MPKFITTDWSDRVGKALIHAGVIRDDPDYISRIVIDLKAGEVGRIYVEYFADDEKLAIGLGAGLSLSNTESKP